ncbi:MAG: hydroxymethylpyrimidine/phosphomethylpyrimidine kinase [Gammaproteobacteria bacterium]|nr:hydroxymethylpyrimidine/phosphomethylpyrimidine kinase [Gammaproteobacteria bacterium]
MGDPVVVLTFGGHDPSSGAGLAADAATLWALGCYPIGVLTAVTVQNSRGVEGFSVLDPQLVADQAHALIRDFPVRAVKTGMLGSVGVVEAVVAVLDDIGRLPLVVDPVLVADNGGSLSESGLTEALKQRLIPKATIVTPNIPEARALSGADHPASMAERIRAHGCDGVLITGTHDTTSPDIVHRWYPGDRDPTESRWPRIAGRFHGSGCTLAAAISAYLSRGVSADDAVRQGLQYTWDSIVRGVRPGSGQHVPNRFFAADHAYRPTT